MTDILKLKLDLEKQDAEFIVMTNLLYFSQNAYKFLIKENWGTELDWKKRLWHNDNSSFISKLIKDMIDNDILIKDNKKITKLNKEYNKYVLSKTWKDKAAFLYIEKHYVLMELENAWHYEIRRDKYSILP